MDRSPRNSYMMAASPQQSPEKATYRLKQLEREVHQYRGELSAKNQQIQYLSQKNSQLLQGKLAASRNQNDNIYEASLQQQIQRLNLKLADKNKQYERLYQKYSTLENEMAILQDFAADLDRQRKFLADKLANIEIHTQGDEVVGELQNKLVLMSTQIMRLGQLNRNKTQQNSDLKFKLKQREQEKQLLENEVLEKEKIIVQYREKIRAIERRLHEIESNKQYENESTYKILSTEIQRLNIQLHNKMEEINTLEHKNRVLQEKHQALSNSNVRMNNYGELEIEVQRLGKINVTNRQEMLEMESDLKRYKKENTEMSENNERYRRMIKKLQDELEETKRNYIKDQNQKIRIEVQTSERTIKQQRSIIEKLQMQVQSHNEQREHQLRKKFQEEIINMRGLLQQSENKCSSLYADLRKYEQKLVMLSQQIERLSLQNNRYQEENAQLKRLQYRIQSKEREIKEIIKSRESTEHEMKRDKENIQRLRIQIREVNDKNKELQSRQYRLTSITSELEIVNDKLQSKERQCKFLQQKLQQQTELLTSSYRVKDLETQLESQRKNFRIRQQQATQYYEKEIQNLKDFINKLQTRVRELSSQQSNNESNYIILADEIRRLNEVLSDSSQTIINQKNQINLLQNNLQTAQRSIQKMKVMYVSNERVEEEIHARTEIYNKEIKLHQSENNSLKIKIQQLISNSAMHEQDAHNFRLMLQDTKEALKIKEEELRDLLEDIKKSKKSEDSLIMLIKDIKESNARLERKLAQIQQDYIRRLQEKSNEKQRLQSEYVEYNRKIRSAQDYSNQLKFQVSSLKNKLELLSKRQRQLQFQNERLQSRLNDQLRDKTQSMKLSNDEYRDKAYEYEQEIKRNARYIGELEADLKNKNEQLYKIQSNLRQLQDEKYRMQNQNKGYQQETRREYEMKNQQYRITIDRKQQQAAKLRDSIEELREDIRNKQKIIQKKIQQIRDYQNKLAMLSQELERINALIYTKNNRIQELELQINASQKSMSKESKDTLEILSGEIARLNNMLCQSLQQVKQLELEVNSKNREIKRTMELSKKNEDTLKDKIFQLEQQTERILRENHRLSANGGVLNKKIEDYQRLEKQNEEFKAKIIAINSQKTKLVNTITDLQSQISSLKNSYEVNLQQQHHSLNSKASIKVTQIQEIKRQLERKVSMLVSQNQELVSQIQKLRRELETNDEENSNNKRELIRTKNQNVNLIREKEKYRLMSEQVMNKVEHITINKTMTMGMDSGQKQAYEFRVKHLENVIKQYENQMKLMKQEIDKTPNRERSRENSSVGSSTMRAGSNNELQQKYNILQSLHLKLKREADGWRQKVTQYEFKMKKLKGQFDLINKLTHQYKDQNEYLRQHNHSQCVYVGKILQNQAVSMPTSVISQNNMIDKNQEMLVKQTLASEIDRLGVLNVNLRREIEDLRLQAVDSQSLKTRYEELMTTFVLTAVEIEALRMQRGN